MKVLIVEDNKSFRKVLMIFLSGKRFICECADSVNSAREKLLSYSYDCILLDIMLPDGNGLDLLRFIRLEKINSGVLIVSAKDALDDKISGLESGGDDYITKPFHLPELHARLRAVYRRKKTDGTNLIACNEITLDTDTMEIFVCNTRLEVTPKEFDLLHYFIVNKNRVLSRQSIATHLWGDYTDNLPNFDFIYQHIKTFGKKISACGGADYIETIYGLGYKFNTSGI